MSNDLKKNLKNLLVEGTEKCLVAMKNLNIPSIENDFIHIYNRYSCLRKDLSLGTIKYNEYTVELSKITESILLVIDSINIEAVSTNSTLKIENVLKIRRDVLVSQEKLSKFVTKYSNDGSEIYERDLLIRLEILLNNYSLSCVLFLNKQIEDDIFIKLFGGEIVEIVEDLDRSLFKKLFCSDQTYKEILDVYFFLLKINKKEG